MRSDSQTTVLLGVAMATAICCQAASAQQATPPWADSQSASPTAEADSESGNWLLTSPLVNVGWPELKMPKLSWNSMGAPRQEGQPGFLEGQVAKIRTAARGAAHRTRSAWNKTVERIKIGGGGDQVPGQPGFFARMFGSQQQDRGPQTVPEFLAQKRPGTETR